MIRDDVIIGDGGFDTPAPASTSTPTAGLTIVRPGFSTGLITPDGPRRDHAGRRRTAGHRRSSVISFIPKDMAISCSNPGAQDAFPRAVEMPAKVAGYRGTRHFLLTSPAPWLSCPGPDHRRRSQQRVSLSSLLSFAQAERATTLCVQRFHASRAQAERPLERSRRQKTSSLRHRMYPRE